MNRLFNYIKRRKNMKNILYIILFLNIFTLYSKNLNDSISLNYSVVKKTYDYRDIIVNIHLKKSTLSALQKDNQGVLSLVIEDKENNVVYSKDTVANLLNTEENIVSFPVLLNTCDTFLVKYEYSCITGRNIKGEFEWEANPVNFFYSFAPPHRLTVAMPDHSSKTLLDCENGKLSMLWTYKDLKFLPYDSSNPIIANWKVQMQPKINGIFCERSFWNRKKGYLPVLENFYETEKVSILLEVVGASNAAIVKITLQNKSAEDQEIQLPWVSTEGNRGYNPGWIDETKDSDCLLAGWRAPANQILILGIGADDYPIEVNKTTQLNMNFILKPNETKTAWLIRPYKKYDSDIEKLRKEDWNVQFNKACNAWIELLKPVTKIIVPDERVCNAYYAGICDIFIMREPIGGGFLTIVPGTNIYRSGPNPLEPAIATVALDQAGLHDDAVKGFSLNWSLQEENGDWTEPGGWGHLMWASSGYKAWSLMEHFLHTRDTLFLQENYHLLVASSRWQHKERQKTRTMKNTNSLTYGLMPRGMGDCGLMDGNSIYGYFYSHNIWAVFADSLSYCAAKILDKKEDEKEMKQIYKQAKFDLLMSMKKGAIKEKDEVSWLASTPGKKGGSSWGLMSAIFPTSLLSPHDSLMSGTIKHYTTNVSPGGLHLHTGWQWDGMWAAISLNDYAEAYLVRGESDKANELLYAVLNHGTPLYSWCEERGKFPNTIKKYGDLQHLWTPIATVRFIRDMLIMEDRQTLHLARGINREWLYSGKKIGVEKASSYFGDVSYQLSFDKEKSKLSGTILLESDLMFLSNEIILHCPLPNGLKISKTSNGSIINNGSDIMFKMNNNVISFEAIVQ